MTRGSYGVVAVLTRDHLSMESTKRQALVAEIGTVTAVLEVAAKV
jgi:hypothetical protein